MTGAIELFKQTIGATIVCLIAISITWLFVPLQDHIGYRYADHLAFMIYFPHGCRLLISWAFGTRSALLLLPSAAIEEATMHLLGHFPYVLVIAIVLSVSPALAFLISASLGYESRLKYNSRTHWRRLLLLGFASSLIETVTLSNLLGWTSQQFLVWWLSSWLGVLFTLISLMFGFRFWRLWMTK
ncbi:MAG: hypothetical protein WCO04_12525 [Pseudomonadota bacterium]